jgi:hypothetical protein
MDPSSIFQQLVNICCPKCATRLEVQLDLHLGMDLAVVIANSQPEPKHSQPAPALLVKKHAPIPLIEKAAPVLSHVPKFKALPVSSRTSTRAIPRLQSPPFHYPVEPGLVGPAVAKAKASKAGPVVAHVGNGASSSSSEVEDPLAPFPKQPDHPPPGFRQFSRGKPSAWLSTTWPLMSPPKAGPSSNVWCSITDHDSEDSSEPEDDYIEPPAKKFRRHRE